MCIRDSFRAAWESKKIITLENGYSNGLDRLRGCPPLIATSSASRIPYNSASKTSFVFPRGRPLSYYFWSISQAIPAPTAPVSSLDPSDQRIRFESVL